MKILTQFRLYVVIGTISFTGLLINHFNKLDELERTKEELNKYKTDKGFIQGGDIKSSNETDSVLYISDSLRDELFVERVDAGRHEVSREEVLSKYPKVKKEYESFYDHQTE